MCQVAESKRYSADQPQGGLEIPCILVFIGSAKDTARVENFVTGTLGPTANLYFHMLHVSTSPLNGGMATGTESVHFSMEVMVTG